jgi:ATP-dependent DNA helicase DinG
LSQGGAATALKGPGRWLAEGDRAARDIGQHLPDDQFGKPLQAANDTIATDRPRLVTALDDLHRYIEAHYPARERANSEPWRFKLGQVGPAELVTLFQQAAEIAGSLLSAFNDIESMLAKAIQQKRLSEETIAAERGSFDTFLSRLSEVVTALADLSAVSPPSREQSPTARWIEPSSDIDGDFICSAAPTSAAPLLRKALWEVCDGAIVTSATLTALGQFNRFFEKVGLTPQTAHQLRLGSPFDYPNNAELHVPAMRTMPDARDAHTREVIQRFNHGLIDRAAGTLVLFSSYRQMRDVAEDLDPSLAPMVLMQGDLSRNDIIDEHKRRIGTGSGSIIFGVASFSEGVDLPGALCTHVIVVKIPFGIPTSIIDGTYAEWLESCNRNPFMEMSVPDASVRLAQSAGRLIRTETDIGRLTILDRRIVTKRYGRGLLDALPPFKRIIEPASNSPPG